jgi:hypothetical protein
MSDRNERIRDAFHDDQNVPDWNRDGVLSGVMQHARGVRRQRVYRLAGVSLVTAVVLGVAWMQLRVIPAVPLVPATFDSIPNNPAEAAVSIQDQERATLLQPGVPNDLMPLLDRRSSFSIDLRNLISKREEFRVALDANPGRERSSELQATIAALDAEIASTRTALRVIDQQLASLSREGAPVVANEAVTVSESPPIVFSGTPVVRQPMLLAGGISVTALLIVFVALAYFRRTMRSAIDALSSFQNQATSQMGALTAGIEAIAIEVERLGENQRFMSKVIVGEKETRA